jgi:hypothetical protein
MDALSDDLLGHVLGLLPVDEQISTAAAVCRRWRRLIEQQWELPSLRLGRVFLEDDHVSDEDGTDDSRDVDADSSPMVVLNTAPDVPGSLADRSVAMITPRVLRFVVAGLQRHYASLSSSSSTASNTTATSVRVVIDATGISGLWEGGALVRDAVLVALPPAWELRLDGRACDSALHGALLRDSATSVRRIVLRRFDVKAPGANRRRSQQRQPPPSPSLPVLDGATHVRLVAAALGRMPLPAARELHVVHCGGIEMVGIEHSKRLRVLVIESECVVAYHRDHLSLVCVCVCVCVCV